MSTPSTKCPKCGSGFRAAYRDAVEYECGSVYYKMLNAAPHGSKTCFRISTLRTSLDKAKDALNIARDEIERCYGAGTCPTEITAVLKEIDL